MRVSHHGHTGTTRHSPRNGFTAYFALSPVTRLFDTVACSSYRILDSSIGASEPHDLAVRLSTIRQLRCSVHRIPPRVRDDREPPLCGTGPNRYSADLPPSSSEILKIRNKEARLLRDDEMHLSFLRPQARNAFLYSQDSRGRHPG